MTAARDYLSVLSHPVCLGNAICNAAAAGAVFAYITGSSLFLITPALTIFAIGFATALGAVAGVLPAWRAARMDPVIALRNE